MKAKIALAVFLCLLLVGTVVLAVALANRDSQPAATEQTPPDSQEPDVPEAPTDPQKPQEPDAPQEPAEEPAKTVRFLCAGDIILHESVFLDANRRAGESGARGSLTADSRYDFTSMYKRVAADIAAADLAMVNQETLIAAASTPTGYEVGFNGPAAGGDALVEVGFDIVNIGNNHMLDRGSGGLKKSMAYWATKEVATLGAYPSVEACDNFYITEKNGVKIAVLAYLGNTPGTNGLTADGTLYIPYLNESLVRRQVQAARAAADCLIVSVHWGTEGTFSLNAEQRSYAAMFASLGVDALIGTHPHVIQEMKWLARTGYPGGGEMLLCNSIGDFLSHTQLAAGGNRNANFLGGLLTFDIEKTGEGSAVLKNVLFTPTVSHYDANSPLDTGFLIYKLEDYTDEVFARFGDTKTGIENVAAIREIVKKNIDAQFLPAFLK